MNKLQVLHIIFIVLSVTVMISPAVTSGPVCVPIGSTTSTPSPKKPAPSRIPEEEKCYVQPAWINELFARHHSGTGLRMNCDYVQQAFWIGHFYMQNWKHSIDKKSWCLIEHHENTWNWFNEHLIDDYLTHYFDDKIKKMAETYPNTEYGCTTMYRTGYSFSFRHFALCIYSRRPNSNGARAPCPDGTN
ncbi:hypothetical protein Q1695_016317 [Nippostrongylus brasiliensis]|nr:hypothetical protein Q1695_016317 [Nippostrongylus brasiliensis]